MHHLSNNVMKAFRCFSTVVRKKETKNWRDYATVSRIFIFILSSRRVVVALAVVLAHAALVYGNARVC